MAVVVEVLTSLSQKKHKDSSNDLNISEGNLELFHQTMNLFCQMSETEIEGMEMQLDIFLKIFSIHQNVLFHYIVTSIQSEGLQRTNGLINDMYALFDKISFNLRLKLMLYEILSSLKSYCIFVSTTGSDNGSRFEVPEQLLKLPPFQISSFMKDEDDSASAEEKIELGISTVNTKIKDNTDKWFIFNKRENQYWCKLHNEPYHFINNFQSGAASSFNNSCLNLSLFNAIFRRQNPK